MLKGKTKIVVVALAITLLVVLAGVLVANLIQYEKTKNETESIKEEIKYLYDNYDQLKNTEAYMQRVEYAEKRARELGMIKEGETIWTLIGEDEPELTIRVNLMFVNRYSKTELNLPINKLKAR